MTTRNEFIAETAARLVVQPIVVEKCVAISCELADTIERAGVAPWLSAPPPDDEAVALLRRLVAWEDVERGPSNDSYHELMKAARAYLAKNGAAK